MRKATKIVATIGPATESPAVLSELMEAGMNVARFNTKHNEPQWHNEVVHRVRSVAQERHVPIGVLLDLQGPEIRIDLPDQTPFSLEKGETVTLTSERQASETKTIFVPAQAIESLEVGNEILLEDGACELKVVKKEAHTLTAQALFACTIKPRKTLNTPGLTLDLPSLTDRDRSFLDEVEPAAVDFVALSFVRSRSDIDLLREELHERDYQVQIVAKIETQAALDNLDEIIAAADAVMIARGDLGVEVPFQELIYWQKTIIDKCRQAAKPVITATEMLKSMVEHPRPTRAEVSDVAHAIYDGTGAVMLSDETTIGKYPVKAVMTQARIAEFNEAHFSSEMEFVAHTTAPAALTHAAVALLEKSRMTIDKVVCVTETGATARLLARYRPDRPIIALARTPQTYHQLSLAYGVEPFLLEADHIKNEADLIAFCKQHQLIVAGETILLLRGELIRQAGITNTLTVLHIE